MLASLVKIGYNVSYNMFQYYSAHIRIYYPKTKLLLIYEKFSFQNYLTIILLAIYYYILFGTTCQAFGTIFLKKQ